VSQSSIASLRRLRSEQADSTRRIRTVIRYRRLAKQRFDDGSAQLFRDFLQFVSGVQCPLPGKNRNPFPAIENIRGVFQLHARRNLIEMGWHRRRVMDRIPF
jgi:hypothetical protein